MNKEIKILIVGNGAYSIYEDAMQDAFERLGYKNTEIFKYEKYLERGTVSFLKRWSEIEYKIQNKFSFGWGVKRLNKALLLHCESKRPELVFLYRCRAVYPGTVKKLKELGCVVFSYNNDDPFSEFYPQYFWRHYKESLQYCDFAFVYRESNMKDCVKAGCGRTAILRSYYIKSRNFPLEPEEIRVTVPKVLFLGHFESDGRKRYLEALAENGIVVGVPDSWKGRINDRNIVFLSDTGGTRYNEMLNAAGIALVFLSQHNNDTYTRRCFEIPATKTMMLSVYTDDLASMFEPDKEAVYFRSEEEIVEKVQYYLQHEEECKKIGQAGYERLMRDGHEVCDRARQVLEVYENVKRLSKPQEIF